MAKTRKKPKTPERRYALPMVHIQAQSPVCTWTGPGPCPRPPETQTEAWARGIALAEANAKLAEPALVAPSAPPPPPPRRPPVHLVRRGSRPRTAPPKEGTPR